MGIFVAVDHLRRRGVLTAAQEEIYFDVEDYFHAVLPDPPFYADGNSIGAVTWFKTDATADMVSRLTPLRDLLTQHGVEHDVVTSDAPGRIVYEDQWQVGVIPNDRLEPTAAPAGLVMGPTWAGSKRVFARPAGP